MQYILGPTLQPTLTHHHKLNTAECNSVLKIRYHWNRYTGCFLCSHAVIVAQETAFPAKSAALAIESRYIQPPDDRKPRERERLWRQTKPTTLYVKFEHASYPGPQKSSLAWL
jgi:hypothetical protein